MKKFIGGRSPYGKMKRGGKNSGTQERNSGGLERSREARRKRFRNELEQNRPPGKERGSRNNEVNWKGRDKKERSQTSSERTKNKMNMDETR